MAEYWKSIPKIYCKFCNVWYQDNKSSRDFHERSFKHKNNLKRHIFDIKKRNQEKQKEDDDFKIEMRKIEAKAAAAIQKDLIDNPSACGSGIDSMLSKASTSKPPEFEVKEASEHARKEALDIVTHKLKKKHDWYESKTVEGDVYYYNKMTMETKWTAPKSGFVSIKEQKELGVTDVPGDQSKLKEGDKLFKHEMITSKWSQVVEPGEIDLELPQFKAKRKMESNLKVNEDEEIEFKEKVLSNDLGFKKKDQGFGFKKRKLNTESSRRIKTED